MDSMTIFGTKKEDTNTEQLDEIYKLVIKVI